MTNSKVCYISELSDYQSGSVYHLLVDFTAHDAVEGISGGICHAANIRGNNDGQSNGGVLYIPVEPTAPACGYDGQTVTRPDYIDPDALTEWCDGPEAAALYYAAKTAWESLPGYVIAEWPGGAWVGQAAAPVYDDLADRAARGKADVKAQLIAFWRACDAIAAAVAKIESLPDAAGAWDAYEWLMCPGFVSDSADLVEDWHLDGTEATRRYCTTEAVESASHEYVVIDGDDVYRIFEAAENKTLKFWAITAYVPDREKGPFLRWWRDAFQFGRFRGPLPAAADESVWVEAWDQWVTLRDRVRYHS